MPSGSWTRIVAAIHNSIHDDRLPDPAEPLELPSDASGTAEKDITFPDELTALIDEGWNKQLAIDDTYASAPDALRKKYLEYLEKARIEAETKKQTSLVEAIARETAASTEFETWLGAIGAGPKPIEITKDLVIGLWRWNESPGIIWDLTADGICLCKSWKKEGTWTIESGMLKHQWSDGRTILFSYLEGKLVGMNYRGETITLTSNQ